MIGKGKMPGDTIYSQFQASCDAVTCGNPTVNSKFQDGILNVMTKRGLHTLL